MKRSGKRLSEASVKLKGLSRNSGFAGAIFASQAVAGDATRSAHAPKACITGKACITHAVRITFRKERITKKSLICPLDK